MHRKIKRKNTNKAFTLVELVIVVAILAILVGILAPQYTKYVEKSRKASDVSNLQEMIKAFQIAYLENSYEIPENMDIWISIRNSLKAGEESLSSIDLNGVDSKVQLAVEADITEILGDQWKNTKLKSGRWGEGDFQTIKVILSMKNGMPHAVEYIPDSLKDYL